MASAALANKSSGNLTRPRVLIVEDEPALVDVIKDVVGSSIDCKMIVARNIAQAKKILGHETIELLLTDVHLPDGDGLTLLSTLRRHQPNASAIVITGQPSVEGAITALRGGAADFVAKPFNNDQLIDRVRKALDRQTLMARQEKRLTRLRDAVKRLGIARRMVSKKVDLLCNDLVSAYGDLSKQIEAVRTQEGFRKYIAKARDLEQLLCHTMDWLLRQLGYANVAVWLAAEDGEFQLGAYMKYTVPGDDQLSEAIRRIVLPLATKDGFVRIKPDELKAKFKADEFKLLKGQEIVAVNSTYLGESLAAVVLFRDAAAGSTGGNAPTGFSAEDEAVLRAIVPIFAGVLASIVREGTNPEDLAGDGIDENTPFHDGPEDGPGGTDERKHNRRDRTTDADWWKRGESPPF